MDGVFCQGSLFDHGRVVVMNSVWRFEIKAETNVEQRQWAAAIQAVLARSPWVERNRFSYTRWLGSCTSSTLDKQGDMPRQSHMLDLASGLILSLWPR